MSTNSLRVAYILKMYPRFSETFIVNEILAHEKAGLVVEIISLRSPADGRFHEDHARVRAPVTYIPSNMPKASSLWKKVCELSAKCPQLWSILSEETQIEVDDLYQALLVTEKVLVGEFDLLHAHFGSIATTVARLVSKLTGVPYIFTAHAKDIFHESVNEADLGNKLRDAAAVITVSDFNVAYLRDTYNEAANTVTRVYNGMSLNKLRYLSPENRVRRIIGVGRLVEKKGFDVLIDACGILATRHVDFECEIIGTGNMEQELYNRIKALGLQERVRLIGPRPQQEVMHHVQSGAVFAAPCVVGTDGNRDGLPTVLLEAMALGTPCVSTDVTGIPEVIRHDHTGAMIPQRDPDALADTLALLLDDAALRVRYAIAARQLIEADFNVAANAQQIRAIYAKIANTQEETENIWNKSVERKTQNLPRIREVA